MDIHLISVGNRMPPWVDEGFREYAKRLNAEYRLVLTEIPPGKRGKNVDIAKTLKKEGTRMLSAIPKGSRVIALDIQGRRFTTEALSSHLGRLLGEGRHLALLVGGPEGLAQDCRARADEQWSLSPLTLPHPLVRIVIAEQLYRAWSILRNHPYHR